MVVINKNVDEFSFENFDTLNETSKFLASVGNDAVIGAGVTDVLVRIEKFGYPKHIVSLNKLNDLNYIKVDGRFIRIGALTTMTEVSESKELQEFFPALTQGASLVGSPQIRNKATIAGNICNASPAADTATPLLVYGAKVKVFNKGKKREVELSDFFVGPGKTVLKAGDIVTEIVLPMPTNHSEGGLFKKKDVGNNVSAFYKLGRRKALEISILNIAVNLVMDGNVVKEAKVACGSVAPKPLLVPKTSEALVGLKIEKEEDLNDVVEVITNEISPIDDIRGTASYRKHMIGVGFKRLVLGLVGVENNG